LEMRSLEISLLHIAQVLFADKVFEGFEADYRLD
jgi:hypothetical protein